uniref:Proteolipid protein 2 n=1 Tax=Sinocyclocheilus anshuiensis TaxID=1608454 RepID=A0A671SKR8_9TELE
VFIHLELCYTLHERYFSKIHNRGTLIHFGIFFIILICYAASMYGGYSAVAICEMVFAIIFFVVFMMELDKQFLVVNWLWSDLIRAVIGAALYLITSLICVISGVFGLLAGILFAYDSYTIFLDIKSSRQHTDAPTGA